MYSTEEELSVLLAIKHGTTSSIYLTNQIGNIKLGAICSDLIKKEYLIDENKKYHLTKKGFNHISELCEALGRKGIDKEIAKIPSSIISKISIYDIYLPKKI